MLEKEAKVLANVLKLFRPLINYNAKRTFSTYLEVARNS